MYLLTEHIISSCINLNCVCQLYITAVFLISFKLNFLIVFLINMSFLHLFGGGGMSALYSETLVALFSNHYSYEVCHISRNLDAIFKTKIPNFHYCQYLAAKVRIFKICSLQHRIQQFTTQDIY